MSTSLHLPLSVPVSGHSEPDLAKVTCCTCKPCLCMSQFMLHYHKVKLLLKLLFLTFKLNSSELYFLKGEKTVN